MKISRIDTNTWIRLTLRSPLIHADELDKWISLSFELLRKTFLVSPEERFYLLINFILTRFVPSGRSSSPVVSMVQNQQTAYPPVRLLPKRNHKIAVGFHHSNCGIS
jgi:hypothetical protein